MGSSSSGGCADVGHLIRVVLRSQCDKGARGDDDSDCHVYVDFENAQPTETECEVYELTAKVLEEAELILMDLKSYGDGASEAIRKAIASQNDTRLQKNAWRTLIGFVIRLQHYYKFSMQLEEIFPQLLWELCSGPLPPVEQLACRQALTKQFAQLLDFALRFDELKMSTPALQNDFSYYRRTMSRHQLLYGFEEEDQEKGSTAATEAGECSSGGGVKKRQSRAIVPVDVANTICLFYAQHTPMLSTLQKAITNFVNLQPELPLTDTLATIADVCRTMVTSPELSSRFVHGEETLMFCLRVMVGAIVLYDHCHPTGAFVRPSAVDVRSTIRVLKERPAAQVENLMNALRYTTKHANDASTPKAIKTMLAAPPPSPVQH